MESGRTLLFLHASSDRDDVGLALQGLLRGLDRARWRPVVALPHDGPLVALLRAAGAVVEVGPLGVVDLGARPSALGLLRFALQLPRALRFVRRLVQRHKPALVHTTSPCILGGALGARLSGARHLWQLHSISAQQPRVERAFARSVARLADVAVSDSYATRNSLDRHSAALASRHRVVHCGIDRASLSLDRVVREAARSELGVAERTTLIVVVGSVDQQDHTLLLDAAERLHLRHPDTELLLVDEAPSGKGRRAVELHEEIERRALSGFVRQLAPPNDRTRALVAADIVVLPSTRPGAFGIVAAAAMACARPVVAAAHAGIEEVVDPGVTGLVFEAGDAERLTWALQVLVEDGGRAREMGRRGAVRQAEQFTQQRVLRELDRLWSQVVSRTFALPAEEARIVHFMLGDSARAHPSEVEQGVHHLAAAQAARGLDVTVLVLHDAPDAEAPWRPYTHQHLRTAERRFELAPEVVAVLDTLGPTAVVHLHGGFVPTLSALGKALARRRIPYVLTPYGAYRAVARRRGGLRLRLYSWLHEWRLLRGARGVQAFSGRERLEMAGLVDLSKVVVVPCGQDLLGAAPALPTGGIRRPLYGYCGSFARGVDGIDSLVQAFALHAAGGGEGTLWLFGGGEDRPRLEAKVHDLGLTRRVAFDGECSGAERLTRLQALDVLVHPSGREGLPTRVLEAAALGRALVLTSDTSLGREVRQHGAGFVLEQPDPEQLAAALAACEREWQAGTLAERGASARAMIAAHFTWSHVEPRLCCDLYQLDDTGMAPRSGAGAQGPSRVEHGDRRRSA